MKKHALHPLIGVWAPIVREPQPPADALWVLGMTIVSMIKHRVA